MLTISVCWNSAATQLHHWSSPTRLLCDGEKWCFMSLRYGEIAQEVQETLSGLIGIVWGQIYDSKVLHNWRKNCKLYFTNLKEWLLPFSFFNVNHVNNELTQNNEFGQSGNCCRLKYWGIYSWPVKQSMWEKWDRELWRGDDQWSLIYSYWFFESFCCGEGFLFVFHLLFKLHIQGVMCN